jgi:hypothetical protein
MSTRPYPSTGDLPVPPEEMKDRGTGLTGQILAAVALIVVAFVAIGLFLRVFAPKPYEPPLEPFRGYDSAPMQAQMSPEAMRATVDTIVGFGSRYLGQPGLQQTEDYLRAQYQALGLKVYEQEIDTPMPHTLRAQVLSPAGTLLPVRVYPFMPNYLQPMVTPDQGLTGELVLLNDQVIRTRPSFAGVIGLLDNSAKPPEGFGYDWIKYAQLGISALLVTHPGGLDKLVWPSTLPMASVNPVNYVRLAATPEILQYVGQKITLQVRTEFARMTSRTIIARLAAPQPAQEAVVICGTYDAASLLPGLAPGYAQAIATATELNLARALAGYARQLRRDVVFVSLGSGVVSQDALNEALWAIGRAINRAGRRPDIVRAQQENATALQQAQEALACFADPSFGAEAAATVQKLASLPPAPRAFLEDQSKYVLSTLVFDLSEDALQAKLSFERAGGQDLKSPEYAAYQQVKRKYDAAFSSAGYALGKLLATKADFARDYDLRRKLQARFEELVAYHQTQKKRLDQALALHDLFRDYRNVLVVCPQLVPSPDRKLPETLSFSMGETIKHGEQAQAFKNLLTDAIARLNLSKQVILDFAGKDQGKKIKAATNQIPLDATLWSLYSYPAFSVVNGKGAYAEWADPVEHPDSRDLESIRNSLAVTGEAVLSAALGNGRFTSLTTSGWVVADYRGQVYVSGVGESIIPKYPLKNALLACKQGSWPPTTWSQGLGWYQQRMFMTDPYGRYEHRASASPMPLDLYNYSPDCATYGRDGIIAYMKDEGLSAQSIYKSMKVVLSQNMPVNLVAFRAAPVTILDTINPQSFKPFSAETLISQKTLAPFPSLNVDTDAGICTTFVKPDERFYVTLKAGSVQNELVQVIRAFMLGTSLEQARRQQKVTSLGQEIEGPGYLAADTPLLLGVPLEIAKSMIFVNGRRLALADRYGMADARTKQFQQKSVDLLAAAAAPDEAEHQSVLQARNSATYAMLNHPVLRQTIAEAVVGILWYLGLLVPFVFFFEKLVFGFTDIRRQLLANLIIFLTVFGLLRLLHPAFMMLRSSTMILLGFLIFLFSAGITLLFWGKFQQNLEQIKQARGQVTAAEINRMGVVGTAFMLGLNNMHRRKLRTGFTCATLVLLTFVMICFTSIRSDLVDQATAVGKAQYSGFLVKNEKFIPLSDAELFAMQTKYGEKYTVAPRLMYVGTEEWPANERNNPKLELVYEAGPDSSRSVNADSMLLFSAQEPLAKHLKFLTPHCWFTSDQERAQAGDIPLLISDAMADKLGLNPQAVAQGPVKATLNGQKCVIQGIFESASLNELTDLDGKTLLPFDITAFANVNRVGADVIAEDTDPRLPAEKVILAPARPMALSVDTSRKILNSVAVVLPEGTPYKQAKAVIDDYLEESGKPTYYGLDNYAFLGKRARQATLLGSIDMLIPLVIAALTVLNTMKGSVYERRDEIFVYNAVGIAPRYIFFMFFAEAFVYAVVGSVLGYVLSQGTGTILTLTGHTGGLNMTFTSATTIYASLAIAASVFLSTYYPARSAMQIAAPAEDAGWALPEPEGDVVSFNLPFTFNYQDRIAILSFFHRYLVDHGEGSSGAFFAGPPELGVCAWCDPLAADGYIPLLSAAIWLKPFDLGVSQELVISLPTDPETREFIANVRMIRLSGTLENWKRANHAFVALLRRHFLYWRAVGPVERAAMFAEARQMLETALRGKEGDHA